MLSQSRTTSSRRGNPMVFGTAKLKHGKKHFVAFFYEIRKNRDSQLKIGWTEEKCIAMDKLAQEDHSYRLSHEGIFEISKTLENHTEQIGQECTDETSIRLLNRSHIYEPSPPRVRRSTCRTNPFSTVPKVAPVFFQFFMVELGQKTGGAQNYFFVVVGSFTADSNLLQPTGVVQTKHLTRHLFLVHSAH